MKKIIAIIFATMMVALSIVPAFAADDLSGNWVFNETKPDHSMFTSTGEHMLDYTVIVNGVELHCDKIIVDSLTSSRTKLKYHTVDGAEDYLWNGMLNEWKWDRAITIHSDPSDEIIRQFILTNAVRVGADPAPIECDGSTCPASDVNFDDICDDCGLPLAYNLRQTPNAVEIVVKHTNMTIKYVYTETIAGTVFNAVYNDDQITVSFDYPVNHVQYNQLDGEWVQNSVFPNTYGSHSIQLLSDHTIQSSDLTVYDAEGEVFFRTPLWAVILEKVQGVLPALTMDLAQTILTIVIAAVGCLALLIGLKIFGKVFNRYRN